MTCASIEKNCKKAKKVISKALKKLDKKNLALIIHANSFPAEFGKNTGFGTSNSSAARSLIDFVSGMFNAIQLGPMGKTKAVDASPYTGTIFSQNPLFIDLEQLTTSEWKEILSVETFERICNENPNKDTNRTAYSYIFEAQNVALKEAWENFKKLSDKKMLKRLEKFQKENSYWLENDALYEALVIENANDYWPMWKNEVDRRLLNPQNDEEKVTFAARKQELLEKYAQEIEFYIFCQFVAAVQSEETKNYALKKDVKLIADRQVAFSDRDTWAYQSLFLDGWCLGCPPDYFSKDGQAWGFPVVNPNKMFNEDGSLGEGGILLKQLYKKMFKENPGGVRIDHIVGLIDPWVYRKGCKPKPEEGAGRLYSSPHHDFLHQFAIAKMEDVDTSLECDKEKWVTKLTEQQISAYGAFIEKIVIAAAKECGLNKDAIVCEDLGTLTFPVESVMKQYKLQGMRLTQFVKPEKPEHPYRGANIEENVWAMVGTHDNEPIVKWAKSMIHTEEGYLHAKNLAEDVFSHCNEQEKNDIIVRLTNDVNFLKETKLVELFVSKAQNIQIFFTDFFGIEETYNKPGTSGDKNWSLRLNDNYADEFCEKAHNNIAFNLPLILKLAIISRGQEFSSKNAGLIKELEEFI